LVISAILGSTLPIASVYLWFHLGFGDLWAAVTLYRNQVLNLTGFEYELLVGTLLGAILNVPIYMALGAVLWAISGGRRKKPELS
jgi:hypothetical protein